MCITENTTLHSFISMDIYYKSAKIFMSVLYFDDRSAGFFQV
jgi:hypothetical protein